MGHARHHRIDLHRVHRPAVGGVGLGHRAAPQPHQQQVSRRRVEPLGDLQHVHVGVGRAPGRRVHDGVGGAVDEHQALAVLLHHPDLGIGAGRHRQQAVGGIGALDRRHLHRAGRQQRQQQHRQGGRPHPPRQQPAQQAGAQQQRAGDEQQPHHPQPGNQHEADGHGRHHRGQGGQGVEVARGGAHLLQALGLQADGVGADHAQHQQGREEQHAGGHQHGRPQAQGFAGRQHRVLEPGDGQGPGPRHGEHQAEAPQVRAAVGPASAQGVAGGQGGQGHADQRGPEVEADPVPGADDAGAEDLHGQDRGAGDDDGEGQEESGHGGFPGFEGRGSWRCRVV